MCGIVGIYGNHNHVEITDMMTTLRHRGNDGMGLYTNQGIALGHQRLSIIDLSAKGNQPMTNESSDVYMVVNGEIYNYKDLRAELKSKGHIFKSESDSEVIVHCYEEYGESFIYKLRGMFALAIYDRKEHKLILARDPIGKKPLYYYQQGSYLIFASEIKALFKAKIPCQINYEMIPSYLMFQYTIGTDTLFKNIKKLSAGHMLIVTLDKTILRQYFTLDDSNRCEGENLRELLEESVKLRLQSDVPIGSFLSGGIDSSAVTALYRKFYGRDLHTFTLSFDTKSEAEYAKIVSKYLDTIYHEVKLTPGMVARDINKITWHHDEPLGDAATINNYYLSQEAKKYVTVVLAGEGGDELFGGYPWYQYANLIPMMNQIPRPLKYLGREFVYFLSRGDITDKGYGLTRKMLFPLQRNKIEMQLYPTSSMSNQSIKWLTGKDCRVNPVQYDKVSDRYNQMLALDALNKLPEQYLMKADKATMAFAIEERLPLLDSEIVKYAFTIEPDVKIHKYIFREAVKDLLPREIIWRKKQGFGTPLVDWLNGGLKEMALEKLSNGKLLREICRKDSLDKLVRYLADGKLKPTGMMALSPANVIWSLFALQIWSEVWFEGVNN